MFSHRTKHIIFGLLIVFLLFSTLAWSVPEEEEDDDPVGIKSLMIKKRVNAAYIMLGVGALDATDLNRYLGSNNLPQVKQGFFTFGLGGHIIQKRVVIGVEWGRYLEQYGPSTLEFNTSLSAKYALLNLGYLFRQDKSLMYYPMLGVGVGILKLRVVENNINNFDDVIRGQSGTEARRLVMLCNVGIALDYFYKYNKKKKGKNSPVFGLRAGYLFSPFCADWKVNRIEVPMGPNTSIQGPYFRLAIGLGGWIETLIKQAM